MADLAGFRAYHTARGNSAPTNADDAVAEAALVRATDYITDEYIWRFQKQHKDPLPDAVDEAIYEAALSELSVEDDAVVLIDGGFWGKTYTPAEAKVLVQVDTIRWQYTGGENGYQFPVSTKIEGRLRPYILPDVPVVIVA
ncbi:DnaT-like ssDNA-binding protein [Ahrensia marina]|uniref:DnaT-like ssDNA-binding protein n=1 Tax=Ahrensia marina TaxID=1514904 RepID=UPI0035D0B598